MADKVVIATRTGTMLVPGVSRNQRLYTRDVIGKAVKRMQERIADPDGLPIVMRTHHGAGDDSTLIVGRIASVTMDDTGRARYAAELYNTDAGRDMVTLTAGKQPAIKSTSIHGYWLGPVKRMQHEGQAVETADDLEVDAIDFTASPGVVDAVLDLGERHATESTVSRTPIRESWDDPDGAVTVRRGRQYEEDPVVEAKDPKKPYGNVQYADPGYQADGVKRYPLDTEKNIRAAWSYINQAKDAGKYTSKQLARIKGRIKAAMKRIGAKISDETTTRLGEIREYYPEGPDGQAGFCVDAYNGPVSLTLRACGLDPSELRVIASAAMDAACDALQAMDPDMDADIDLPGAPNADSDGDLGTGETVTVHINTSPTFDGEQLRDALQGVVERNAARQEARESTRADTAGDTTQHQEEVPAVSEAQQTAAETTAAPTGRTLSDDDLKALGSVIGQALKEHVQPPAAAPAPVASETASPTTETQKVTSGDQALKETVDTLRTELQTAFDAKLAQELDKQRAALRAELVKEYGTPPRKGFRVHETDGSTGNPEIDDLWDRRTDVFLGSYGKTPVPVPGTGMAPPAQTPAPAQ